jgi:hypothetical protein
MNPQQPAKVASAVLDRIRAVPTAETKVMAPSRTRRSSYTVQVSPLRTKLQSLVWPSTGAAATGSNPSLDAVKVAPAFSLVRVRRAAVLAAMLLMKLRLSMVYDPFGNQSRVVARAGMNLLHGPKILFPPGHKEDMRTPIKRRDIGLWSEAFAAADSSSQR